MKKHLLACLLFSTVASSACLADPILLSDLIDGSLSYRSGNKTFSNFTYSPIGEMPTASEISVDSIPGGIRFFGDFQDSGDGQVSDSLFTFDVDFGDDPIERATLRADLTVDGSSGFGSITETFLPLITDRSIAIFSFANGDEMLMESIEFDSPISRFNVQKDVILAANAPDTTVRLTFFDQIFDVPEPGFGLFFAIGVCGMILAFQRVQQKSMNRCHAAKD